MNPASGILLFFAPWGLRLSHNVARRTFTQRRKDAERAQR